MGVTSFFVIGFAAVGLGVAFVLHRRQHFLSAGDRASASLTLLERRKTDRYLFRADDSLADGGASHRASRIQEDRRISRPLHTVSVDCGEVELAQHGNRRSDRASTNAAGLGAAAGVDSDGLERPEDIAAAALLAQIARNAQAAPSPQAPGQVDAADKQAAETDQSKEAEGEKVSAEPPKLAVNDVVYYKHRALGWLLVKVLRIDYEGASDGGETYVVGGAPQLKGAEVETTRERLSLGMP